MNKIRENIALFNSGASYIMAGVWFIIMAAFITSYNALAKAVSEYSKYTSSSTYDKALGELAGNLALSIFFFIVSMAAVVFGMKHARNCIKGAGAKSVSGLVSTISCAIVWGYAAISSIISYSESKKASSDILGSLFSSFSASWIFWVILIFEIIAVAMAIVGFVFVLKSPAQGILTAKEQTDNTIGGPMSVVQQFAKPEKKDLPPMLNGDQAESTEPAANPSISGLRSIAPIEQADTAVQSEPADTVAQSEPAVDNSSDDTKNTPAGIL